MKPLKLALLRKFGAPIAMLAGCATASAAPWTSVGSAGTVDETDLQTVVLSGAGANISANAALPETATLRYNVVAVDGLLKTFGSLGGARVSAVFKDTGGTARVQVRLREVENRTGLLRTIVTLNSDAFPASSGFQRASVDTCKQTPFVPFNFDFERKAYYIEADLLKGAADAQPSLGTIEVRPTSCVVIE